jgi:hypothetical protein
MNRRGCVNHPDNFCYVCGKYTTCDQRKNLTKRVTIAYKYYFGCIIGDQDKSWAPHVCCTMCYSGLTQWLNGKRNSMPFAVPMVWREQKNHHSDCYFCMTKIAGFSKKNKHKIVYPNCESALKPVPHDEDNPVPVPPHAGADETDSSDENPEDDVTDDESYDEDFEEGRPHLLSKDELDDLVRDLTLSKEKSELLASRLREWNLLQKGTTTSHYRYRHKQLVTYYKLENDICFCNDVNALMLKLGCEYVPDQWRLFIDSSKASLKAVLLHNGNEKPSVPIAHAVGLKETYDSMKLILKVINYSEHNWNICADLKVVSLLLGLQLGYTKHMCFLCLWNSRDDSNHYKVKQWPPRSEHIVGRHNVQHESLVDPSKVYLPPLHIKLGLVRNFVVAMDRNGQGFQYLKEKFGAVKTDAKLKAGIFIGPEIREIMRDTAFRTKLNPLELAAWDACTLVVQNFLGNHRAENYCELVTNMLTAYKQLGCRMSLKIHFLHSHLDFFPTNLGDVSDEHGERFHQDISTLETRYQGHCNPNMMGDYCWFLQRATTATHKRKSKCLKHF